MQELPSETEGNPIAARNFEKVQMWRQIVSEGEAADGASN
jgi:hypothetical protein